MFVLGLLTLLLFSTSFDAGATPPIEWNPQNVQRTIGNGDGPTEDMVLTVTSQIRLTDVDLRIVRALAGFVEVTPNHFDVMEPGVSYEVRMHFSVAPGAEEKQYDGTIQVRTSKRVIPLPLPVVVDVDYGDIEIPPTTKVLSKDVAGAITSIEPTAQGYELSFPPLTGGIAGLTPGDVLVVNVCEAAPMGFLGRVTANTLTPDGIVVSAVPARLEEAITDGTIQLSRELGPGDVAPGGLLRAQARAVEPGMIEFYLDNIPIIAGIEANGRLGVGMSFDFTLGLSWGSVRHIRSVTTLREAAEVSFHFNVPIAGFEHEVTIGNPVYFTPIVVWAGFVPVVFVPQMRAYAEIEGSASVGVETKVLQDASMSLGLQYDDGDWSPVADFTHDLRWEPPHFTAGCEVKGSVGEQFNLLLYGLVGPYTDVKGYAELDVDFLPSPSWELYGGIEAGAGVRVDVLGETIADYEFPTLIGLRVLLARSETNPGFVAGNVTDAVTHQPLAGVTVNIRDIIGNVITTGTTGSDGAYSLTVAAGTYLVDFSKPGYIPVDYFGVTVTEGETVYLEPVLQIDEAHAGVGTVSGRVINALSGGGVSGMTVHLREGLNSTTGAVVASTTSGSGGSYLIGNLEAGNYTAEVGGSGYLTSYFGIVCIGGQVTPNQDVVVTPILPADQIRIVLTWGASPRDLDSHTWGPLPGGSRFHMYWWYAQSNNGSPWPAYVKLDLDDITSYGPETTTLLQQIPGVYRYSVHDYTNRLSGYSTALSSSGALVRVYGDEGLIASFPVPTGQQGTLWNVFEIEGGNMTPLNTFQYTSYPGASQIASSEDLFDWQSMPEKGLPIPSLTENGDESTTMPSALTLGQAVPNPFNPISEISYAIPSSAAISKVVLEVCDVRGRRVRYLVNQAQGPGEYRVTWDGKNDHGAPVAGGVYFYRLVTGTQVLTRKAVLLK
jgi:hypothetical protein